MGDRLTAERIGERVRMLRAASHPCFRTIAEFVSDETARWFESLISVDTLRRLTRVPPETGDPRWDAFIEGIAARRFHENGLPAPKWTERTTLIHNFDPMQDSGVHVVNLERYRLDQLNTPTELRDKRIVFPLPILSGAGAS